MAENLFVTVIIPTYNDWERLGKCINALAQQSYPADLFEIIVVNNNPNDAPPANFLIPGNCRIITEAKPGSYAARNTAIKLAKGDILAFTDSDCIPDKEWISNAVDFLGNNPQYARIGGRVALFFSSKNLTNAELYDKVYAFRQHEVVRQRGTSVTANMITYKHVFDSVGLFDENLLSGGDFEWGKRANEAGFKIGYASNVIVNHPARASFKELIKKSKRVAGGHATAEMPVNIGSLRLFLRHLKSALRPPLNQIKIINEYKEEMNTVQRAKVFFMIYYLKAVMATEKFKIQTGKAANRA